MKSQTTATALFLIAGSLYSAQAAGQNIYKCGGTYSERPCDGGTAIQAADSRSASQAAQTGAAAKRDAKAADAMEKTRLKAEAQPVQVYIPPKAGETREAKSGAKKTLPKIEMFRAVEPTKPGQKTAKKK